MRLNRFTDYSLRVLIYLATEPEQRTTIARIATAYGISEHHLVKVVHFLGQQAIRLAIYSAVSGAFSLLCASSDS